MDKVQKHNSFNTNTPSSESYRNYSCQNILCYRPTPKPLQFRNVRHSDCGSWYYTHGCQLNTILSGEKKKSSFSLCCQMSIVDISKNFRHIYKMT